jgi:quinol monooxygenase YgiN/mannose-6-phosphate isomerase-like protein (cupin superfamily)
VGRYVKLKARANEGPALAAVMLRVAEGLRSTAGCELYVINRTPADPDTVWVNELWSSQEAVDASLQDLSTEAGKAQLAEVMALLDGPPERIDVEPLGGVGFLAAGTGSTVANLGDVEDLAPKFGYGWVGEARFATGALDAAQTGVSYQRLRPGVRQAFGHRHRRAEEVYVVLAGNGRVKIDDEIRELHVLDAVRIAPESRRAFEAGPDGLDLLVFGPHRPGDAVMDRDFWPA